jgi:hypothetical protein
MDKGSYAEMFNSDLNRLNSIIAKTTSLVCSIVKGLGENGSLRFEPGATNGNARRLCTATCYKKWESSMDLMRMK